MVEAAPENREISVRRAFIDGIRTVVIVDDQMRPYDQVITESASDREEAGVHASSDGVAEGIPAAEDDSAGRDWDQQYFAPRASAGRTAEVKRTSSEGENANEDLAARALVKDFRRLGWFCDIVNEAFQDEAFSRAIKSDMVVLDYMLGNSWKESVKILNALAHSSRLHLVVVYTREDEVEVWRNICLMMAKPLKPLKELANFEEANLSNQEMEARDTATESTVQEIVDCLAGRISPSAPIRKNKVVPPLAEQMKPWRVYKDTAAAYAAGKNDRATIESRPVEHLEASSNKLKWLRCDNVFVVVQHKKQQPEVDQEAQGAEERALGGDALVERLADALSEWNPSFFRRMLRYIRSEIAHLGLAADAEVLRGPIGEAALLVYAHRGGPEEQLTHRRRIYLHVFESVLHRLLDDDFVRNSVEAIPDGHDVLTHAANLTNINRDADQERVFFRLNSFLAFEEKLPPYLRTGTVFCLPDRKEWVGICVTPECDLVPREKKPEKTESSKGEAKKGQEKEPKPRTTRAVLWRMASLVVGKDEESKGAIRKALKRAEDGYALFLGVKNDSGVEEECLLDLRPENKEKIPKASMFFVANEGRIEDDFFEATQVFANEEGIPEVEPAGKRKYRVIGQLRESYATRVLHESGQEFSRVGVDFVSMR